MNIASAPFLFLFLPAVAGVYYLIPGKNDLRLRNIFLTLASLFFYTWGEPVFIFLLLGMIFLTWLFGRMAFQKKNTRIGKTAVCLTIITNLAVMLAFGKSELILDVLSRLSGKDLSGFMTDIPIGFSFFVFSSVSYVVDSYRGQCGSSGSILQAALYTGGFFRILQGPIIPYRKFESQIRSRQHSPEFIGNGIWRVSVGLCKKIIIADNLSKLVTVILPSDLSGIPLFDAWLGCISYLVCLYFDFSGYSDMAIGLAELFGFSVPENFNYPYCSASIAEFWRRWHITLCAWFTEYLYYPIMLGPSIRLRKFLQRHNVRTDRARTLQNIFVTAAVWLATALWHGMNLRYAVWGLLNCAGMLLEPHMKPLRNKRLNTVTRRAGLLLFWCLSMPLIGVGSFNDSILLYKAMFTGFPALSDAGLLCIRCYGSYLFFGIIGCFPVIPYMKKRFLYRTDTKYHVLWDVCAAVLLVILVIVSVSFILEGNAADFLYQQ